MKKSKLLILSLVSMMTLGLSSCSSRRLEGTNLEANIIEDNYRTFYEIFVGGFSDSNKDGMGDLRGIINRFDFKINNILLAFRTRTKPSYRE